MIKGTALLGGLFLTALILLAACDGGGEKAELTPSPSPAVAQPSPTSEPTAVPTPTHTPTEEPAPQTAVTSETGAYIVRPDGSGLHGPINGFGLGWSPDGTRIAVVTDLCERTVSVATADSGSIEQLAPFARLSGSISGFEWAPDSQRLLLGVSQPPPEDPFDVTTTHVFVVNASGQGEPIELFLGNLFAWSPDGGKIAYIDDTTGTAGQLRVLNLSDRSTVNLGIDAVASRLAWSPDGTRLAFSTDQLPSELIVMNADGSGRRVVASGGSRPLWMPDGQRIVFQFQEQSGSSIAIVPADGGSVETLRTGFGFDISRDGSIIAVYDNLQTHTEIEVFRDRESLGIVSRDLMPVGDVLALSPDGSQLIFNAQDETTERRDLYLVNVDGTGLRKLVQPSVSIGADADWSSDGKFIAFKDTVITGLFFCPNVNPTP